MFFILYPITRYFTQLTACAVRCTLPGKCPPMQAWRPLSRRIAQKAVLSKMLERTAQNRVIFEAGAKKKKSRNPHGYWIFRWRRVWDSNPRALADNRISSAARYDHFDNSPSMFSRRFSPPFSGEKGLWKELTERTAKYSVFRTV